MITVETHCRMEADEKAIWIARRLLGFIALRELLASDHIHLYIDATPHYSLDEIVHAIMDDLERERVNLFPALQPNHQPVWERAYFAEGIG